MITDSSRHPLSPLSLHSSFNPKGCDHTFFFSALSMFIVTATSGWGGDVRQLICSRSCPPCMSSAPTRASDRWEQRDSPYLPGRVGRLEEWTQKKRSLGEGRGMFDMKKTSIFCFTLFPLISKQWGVFSVCCWVMPSEVYEHPSKENIYLFTNL